MTIEIRTITPDEFTAWVEALHVPFFMTIPAGPAAEARRPHTDLERVLGAFDGADVVGTWRSFASSIAVPGGTSVAADAVSMVTTLPTHRRRGVLTGMMTSGLQAAAARGEPVSILIASEYPIYGRFGYGPATENAAYRIDTRAVRFLPGGGTDGTVELVARGGLRELAPPIFERFRLAQPGAISRRDVWWDIDLGLVEMPGYERWKGWCVVVRGTDGAADGYARYHAEEKWDEGRPQSTIFVDDLVAATPAAYARLWRFICEMDLVTTVRADGRSVDEALPWLLEDARAMRQTTRSDYLWLRVLDVGRALASRRYLAEGRLVLEVEDPAGFAAGRYLLEGGPDGADCRATNDEPDLCLPVASLGALYLGGPTARLLTAAGLIEERRRDGVRRADAMFRSAVTPWCNTHF